MPPFNQGWNTFLVASTTLLITILPIIYSVGSRYRKSRDRALSAATSSINLPYFAPNIPRPLPTNSEIEKATLLVKHNGYKVVKVGNEFVVKFGTASQVDLLEGVNMLFVQQATKVKVPQVYALYQDSESSTNYIIMEFIKGDTLDTQWAQLTRCQKSEIATTLRQYFQELRDLSSPGFFGSIGKNHLLHGIFWTPQPTPSINGPFDSESALNEALALKYIEASDNRTTFKADFYRRSLSQVFRGHVPKFTHGDFQRKNIIIRRRPNDTKTSQYEITLIDWETAGWYPSYWEYSIAMCASRWDDDWDEWIAKILQPFDAQFPWLKMLYLDLWS
ncbi:hypothetical protein EMCG_01489 [[Emmonsia] crescens]|uniref:Aminoglycoside phosphotransferase domain-containing protein n=1 Tax=[Emmonsia] crescens TaxID=73230 RepID=A0A0G2J2L2_9EURO|nr:hypothetical protein EMCG_01489 [Emmonsia crescens UAMH 3008]